MNLKSLFIQPKFPENLAKLHELAGNLWCTWNHDTIGLFYRIDAHLFRTTNHNPMEFLLNLPPERIHQLSEDQ